MVFKLTESRDSQEATTTPPSLIYRYNATGSNDRAYVQAYALAATPGIVAGPLGALLHRQDVAVKPAGFECWKVEVPYAEKTIDTGALDIEFDTTGGSVHITASKQTIAAFGTGASTNDYKQLIGVTSKDDVEGADVEPPVRNARDRRAPVRQLRDVAPRAVDRVDVPAGPARAALDLMSLLAPHALSGKEPREPLDEVLLDRAVRVGHRGAVGLALHEGPPEAGQRDLAGLFEQGPELGAQRRLHVAG